MIKWNLATIIPVSVGLLLALLMTSGCTQSNVPIKVDHPPFLTPKTDELGSYYESKDVARFILKQYEAIEQCRVK
jgi:hypothetical protein